MAGGQHVGSRGGGAVLPAVVDCHRARQREGLQVAADPHLPERTVRDDREREREREENGSTVAPVILSSSQLFSRLIGPDRSAPAALPMQPECQRMSRGGSSDLRAHPHRERGQAERADVEHTALRQALHAFQAPVVDVLGILGHAVVLGQRLGEERLEVVVVRRLAGVATHPGVDVLCVHTRGTSAWRRSGYGRHTTQPTNFHHQACCR